MPDILILTEAGDGIGLGHFTRCNALFEAMRQSEISCKMIVHWEGEPLTGTNNSAAPWLNDYSIAFQNKEACDIILIDSYKLELTGYFFFRSRARKLIVIDDYNRLTYPADILINPNVYFNKIDYSNQVAHCMGGESFVILRKQFRLPVTPVRDADTLFVTVGGSDTNNLLPLILDVLGAKKIPLRIVVVCPDATQRDALQKRFPEIIFAGFLSAQEIAKEFARAVWVISACGQTLHELASMNKPTIGIRTGSDQLMNQAYYLEKGFLTDELNYQQTDLSERLHTVIEKMEEAEVRATLQNIGSNFALAGEEHIVKILPKPELTWKLAERSDATLYFEWANDPDVRSNAFHSEPIIWEDHCNWFNKKINSDSLLLVFFGESIPVGQLRIDWDKSKGCIDFSVAPSFRGQGLSRKFLSVAIDLLKKMNTGTTIYGQVKRNNIASLKAFASAGFQLYSEDEQLLEFKKDI